MLEKLKRLLLGERKERRKVIVAPAGFPTIIYEDELEDEDGDD